MKAFPSATGAVGMELRDYFAAKAMQSVVLVLKNTGIGIDKGVITQDTYRAATCAYAIADAMMKEREQ